MLKYLGKNLGYDVEDGLELRLVEDVQDSLKGQQDQMDSFIHKHNDYVKCKHYSFINDFGNQDWSPDWFSIVRNPIERVRS